MWRPNTPKMSFFVFSSTDLWNTGAASSFLRPFDVYCAASIVFMFSNAARLRMVASIGTLTRST